MAHELHHTAGGWLHSGRLFGRCWVFDWIRTAGGAPGRSLKVCTIGIRCILMKTRVTITLDPEVHRLAKRKARRNHTTVSGLIESLLQSETAPAKTDLVASMTGSASLRKPVADTDPLHDALKANYLRG